MRTKPRVGDIVYVGKLPAHSSHFFQDMHAIVIEAHGGEYALAYLSEDQDEYAWLDPVSASCWYSSYYLNIVVPRTESLEELAELIIEKCWD